MSAEEISIQLDLHQGNCEGQAWGCDLSYDYVKINTIHHLGGTYEKHHRN